MLLTDSCCSGSNLCRLCFFLYGSEITTNCKCNFYFIFFVWVAHIYQMCWTLFCCADAYQTFRWFPGFAAIKMINSAAVALYLERCAELLPQLSNSDAFNLEKNKNKRASISSILCPLPFYIHSVIVLCGLDAFSAVITVHSWRVRPHGRLFVVMGPILWKMQLASDVRHSLSTVRGPRKALWLVPARFCFTACTRC